MLSGRKLLGLIDRQLAEARQQLDNLSRMAQQSATAVGRNRQAQAEALRRLAASRLEGVRRGAVAERLDSLDRQAQVILADREQAMGTLSTRLAEAEKALESLESERRQVHKDVDDAARQVAEREAAVQAQLEDDAAYQAQLEETRRVQAVAVGAADKADTAEADRREKGKPYEDDEFFMYLWHRGYATPEYRANPLARLLDGWVAHLCSYREARTNYWTLLEIPKRLRQHARQAREAAEREVEKLAALEEQAAREGGVEDAQAAFEGSEARQDAVDERIARAEDALDALRSEQREFASGRDRYLERALAVFSEAMERQDVTQLMQAAMATMTPEDDAIVAEIRRLRAEADELQQELLTDQQGQTEYLRRAGELGDVRRRFKQSRFDDARSGFENVDRIARAIGEVVSGTTSGSELWEILRRSQRYRNIAGERPDFGSGGIVFPRTRMPQRGPTWRWPAPSTTRTGGFRLPPASRGGAGRRGGGFRTGGGF